MGVKFLAMGLYTDYIHVSMIAMYVATTYAYVHIYVAIATYIPYINACTICSYIAIYKLHISLS